MVNGGTLTVLEFKTGEVVYDERVSPEHPSEARRFTPTARYFWSAPMAPFRWSVPGREFEVLAKNDLGEYLAASPAISDGTLYLRTYEALYAIGTGGAGAGLRTMSPESCRSTEES